MAFAFFLGGVKPSLSSSSSSPEISSDSARPLVDGREMTEAPPLTAGGFVANEEDPGIMATATGLGVCEEEEEAKAEDEEEGVWIS